MNVETRRACSVDYRVYWCVHRPLSNPRSHIDPCSGIRELMVSRFVQRRERGKAHLEPSVCAKPSVRHPRTHPRHLHTACKPTHSLVRCTPLMTRTTREPATVGFTHAYCIQTRPKIAIVYVRRTPWPGLLRTRLPPNSSPRLLISRLLDRSCHQRGSLGSRESRLTSCWDRREPRRANQSLFCSNSLGSSSWIRHWNRI